MYDFDFVTPASLAEAAAALEDPEAMALGGGQTLIPTLRARLAMPSKLVSLAGLAEIRGICEDDDGRLCIGGATTHGAIARDAAERFSGLAGLAQRIGDPAVRNRGTLGGSVANNDPAACYPAAILATGATVVTHRREIAAGDFFQGMFTTALDEGEIVTEVRFPVPRRSAYQKFEQPASRFALVGVFVAEMADGAVGVGVTGAAEEGGFRWEAAEAALAARFDPAALEGLSHPAEGLISDIHGDAAYRAHLIGVMTRRAVAAAA
ncbi:carbon monoxide dehydrogenase [Rhodobacteraceae bacterium CCMM004]|nr:carbon monoxide dehydrogenase [Rhodobacteraceae bacterium CCMM004]